MSQAGELDVIASHPQIPTMFPTDSGTAVPSANTLNIFGGESIHTSGAGNTVTIAFDGTFTGNTGIASMSSNNLNILGNYVLAGAGGPLLTAASGHQVLIDVQLASAQASSSANNAGVASFNSTEFSVDANGYVSTSGIFSETLTGNSGGAVGPTAGNINTIGTGSITIVGNPGTSTLTTELTGLTQYDVLVGQGSATIGLITPSATSGVPLISQGSASYPIFGTAVVAGGGTGNTTFTAYSVICAGTTATGVFQNVSGLGSSGNVLTSNGAGALPTWQALPSSAVTFTGDSGTPFSTSSVTITGGTTGLTFAAASPDLTLGGTLKLANGGTNANLTASNGGIFYSTATAGAILSGTATANQMLQSGSSTAPAWSTATWPATTTINQILYSSSASVVAGLATADNGVLTTGTTGIPVITALASDGQVIIGSSAGAPAAATLSAGTGITITNGHNTITIASSGTTVLTVTALTHASSPYTVLSTDDFLAITGSVGTFTVKLPNAPATGRVIIIKDTNGVAATDNIAVTTVGGSVTIDGSTTYTIATNYQSISVIFDGSNYEVF